MRLSSVRHHDWRPSVICTVTRQTLNADCVLICNRIRSVTKARGCGVMMFVDNTGCVRLVPEESGSAPGWFRDKLRDYIGLYTVKGSPESLSLAIEGVMEDIADHMGWT